jgi:hypothetical protein
MNWTEEYKSEIEQIFAEAAADTALFPYPLNEIGLALLAKFNPLQTSVGTNYISFLLPIWLKEQTESSDALCRELAVANVFAMIHFFLLDDVIDVGAGLNKTEVRDALVLGQLFQALFQQRYSRHFSAGSPLWMYYRNYMVDWASAISQEGKIPADPQDPGQLARKSAPVKLCAVGMLLLSGQQESIPHLEEAIDLTLATLQLSDDWADWRDDLAEENCSAFLTLVRQRLSLPPEQPLDERKVKQAIYRANCLDSLADIVQDYGERLKKISHVPAILIEFHYSMCEAIRKEAWAAENTTVRLASGGGLSYFLSNITRN